MARKSNRSGRRVVSTPTLPHRVLPPPQISTPLIVPTPRPRPLTSTLYLEVEDRRTFHPSGPFRSPRTIAGGPSHRLVAKPSRRFSVPTQVMFDAPPKVLVCVRRNVRKRVLHALKKTGKSGGGRKPRRNLWSSISCR